MPSKSVLIDVMFRSTSGLSLRDSKKGLSAEELSKYSASEEVKNGAIVALKKLGFEMVGPPTNFGITISGSHDLVRKIFGEEELTVPESLRQWIDWVRIPPPAEFY